MRREDRTDTGDTQVITLIGYTTAEPALPAEAVRQRAAVRQTALETVSSGEAMVWHDGASGISGTVRPVSTMQSPRRGWCRLYEESIQANTHRYHMERVACRTRGGSWQLLSG